MTFRKHFWLLVPLVAAVGCAGSQQSQKVTKAGGNSTLVDEGPAGAAGTAAAAGATGAAAAGQAAAPALVPYQGANGFTVLMPPNPEKNERTQDTPGGPVQVHIAQAQDPAGKYMSSLSEFPQGSLDKVKSKDLLDSLQQATIQSMGGTLVNSHDVQVGGLDGREFTATDPEGSEVTARVFVGRSRVYTLAGTYPKGQMPGSIQQFLGSFQPPPETAVGGSGAPENATDGSPSANGATGDSVSGTAPDTSMSASQAQPTRKTKKSRRSTSSSSTTTESSADTASGSR